MSKWILIGASATIILGLGLWVEIDPSARAGAAQVWSQAKASFAEAGVEIDSQALWAPVAAAFRDFADSVGGLWSGTAIHIEMPSIQLEP